MKILQVFNRYNEIGGEELSVERISDVLSEHHQVFHCYFESRTWVSETSMQESRLELFIIQVLQGLRMFYNPQSVNYFKKQVAACQPDIILLHNIFPVGSIGVYLAALQTGIPICHYIHNFRPYSVNGYLWANGKLETAGLNKNFFPEIFAGSWQNSRIKTALYACVLWTMHLLGVYRKLDGWIAISDFMRQTFINAGVPAEKIFLLKHSWQSSNVDGVPVIPAMDQASPYFLFLGRITDAKGIKILFKAWQRVESKSTDARLVIAGDGPLAEWLVTEIQQFQRIEFRGFVTGVEKEQLLQGCSAMIVPSEWWEPLGLVVFEAYQYQRSVIAAGSGGLLETVVDGETGWLYPPGDVEALSLSILSAIESPDEATRRGKAGFEWMGIHSQCSTWLSNFDNIASEIRSRRGLGHAESPKTSPDKPVTFSIITASFKQIPYLSKCAASVADQGGGFVVEHLVHDGKSGSEFDAWAKTQTFASCISQEDSGMYDAINHGFKRAKGEFIAWLNCDEQYLPGSLLKVKKWFDENPEMDILFGDVVLVNPEGVPLAYRKAIKPLVGHVRHCFLSTYSAATFVRRKVIDQGYLIDTHYRAIADGVWIVTLLNAGFKMGVLNEPLAVFTQTGSNLGQSEVAYQESVAWRNKLGNFQLLKRNFWSCIHRFRKLLAGAYQAKNVSIRIFVTKTTTRCEMSAIVGERWITSNKVNQGHDPLNKSDLNPEQNARESSHDSSTLCSSMPDSLKIATVFATMNRVDTATACLLALSRQSRPPDLVVVADNCSMDGTADALDNLEHMPFTLVVRRMKENRGNAGGIEEAMDQAFEAGADAVWILDDDSWPREAALEALLAGPWNPHIVRHALQVDLQTGKFTWPLQIADGLDSWRLVWSEDELPQRPRLCTSIAWTGALISREVREAVGPVNGDLFIRGEDEEYPWRIERAGFQQEVIRGAVLDHPGPKEVVHWHFFGKNFFFEPDLSDWKLYYKVRNMVWLKRKQGGALWAIAIALAYTVATTLIDRPHRLGLVLSAVRDGWMGRLGKWQGNGSASILDSDKAGIRGK